MNYKTLLFLLLLGSLQATAQSSNDSITIVRLLEKESATWRSGDLQGHADCWAIKPYSRILISTADGQVIDLPPQMMITPPKEIFGQGGHSTNSDYRMSIQGKQAWVSHQEESVTKDGVKSYSYEIRMLEKIKGKWKLVGQSIHIVKK